MKTAQSIYPLSQKQRQSNMELLRIIAMLLVLVVHSSWLSLGAPTYEEAHSQVALTLYRCWLPSISICCVNTFVMISGYFGINFSFRKLLSLLFQVAFYILLIDIVILLFTDNYDIIEIIKLSLLHAQQYWFVKAYIMLMLLAPGLNMFVKNSSRKQILVFLTLFYTLQTCYGWIFIGCGWFSMGYSPISFVGLYVLARYLRLYPLSIQNKYLYLLIFLITSVLLCFAAYIMIYTDHSFYILNLFFYTSPAAIMEAACLMLFFQRIKIQSRLINWIASSALSVYLLHANELVLRDYYGKLIKSIFDNNSFITYFVLTSLFIIVVFIISIFLDKFRIAIWNKLHRQWDVRGQISVEC